MSLLQILTKYSPNKVFFSLVLGSLAGLLYALLIPLIMMAVSTPVGAFAGEQLPSIMSITFDSPTSRMAFAFVLMLGAVLVFTTVSQLFLLQVTMEAVKTMRMTFYHKVSKLPLQDLERMGPARLMAVITGDIPNIIRAAMVFPSMIVDLVTILGVLGFVLYMEPQVFGFVLAVMFFGIVTYQLPVLMGFKLMQKARDYMDNMHEMLRALLYGAKELKLNKRRREDFFLNHLEQNEKALMKMGRKAESVMIIADTYGRIIVFFAIGAATFYLVYMYTLEVAEITGIVIALLYLTTPIEGILNKIGMLQQGKVALNRFNKLYTDMPEEHMFQGTHDVPDWDRITLRNLKHDYSFGSNHPRFHLGPVSLTLERGEVTFIVGGNGSGKSTLAKLLTLHYLPKDGEILFGDTAVNDENRASYRQEISAIYSDFFLFKSLLGINQEDVDKVANEYLKDLELEQKVTVKSGLFSTTELSDGQRKRLALLVSFLEDRDFYLFDEWAADQDPAFKKVFYDRILGQLKARGKVVVVISHDDRYFHMADKVITMENGNVRDITKNAVKDNGELSVND